MGCRSADIFLGVERVDEVEWVDRVGRDYPLATQNYSHYPAYSKFLGLDGLNGVAISTRPTKAFNSFLPFLPCYPTKEKKRMSNKPIRFP